jgi:hypothetical protein
MKNESDYGGKKCERELIKLTQERSSVYVDGSVIGFTI